MASGTDAPPVASIALTGSVVGSRATYRADVQRIPFGGMAVGSIHTAAKTDTTYESCGCCGTPCPVAPCAHCDNGYYGPRYIQTFNAVDANTYPIDFFTVSGPYVNFGGVFDYLCALVSTDAIFLSFAASGPCQWSYAPLAIPVFYSPLGYPFNLKGIFTFYYDSGWKLRAELADDFGVPLGKYVIFSVTDFTCNRAISSGGDPIFATIAIESTVDCTAYLQDRDANPVSSLYWPYTDCGGDWIVVPPGCCTEPVPRLLQAEFSTHAPELIYDSGTTAWAGQFSDGTFLHYAVLECVSGNWRLTIYNDPTPTGGIAYQQNATTTVCYPFFLHFPSDSGWGPFNVLPSDGIPVP